MSNGRLLVMDDDPATGRMIGLMAESAGFQHRAVSLPGEFFRELDEWNPTHIVLDLVMPEMDGVEIMQHLADRLCKASIIISSGVEGRIRDAAQRAAFEHDLNVVGALSKPFRADDLKALVHSAGQVRQEGSKVAGEPDCFDTTERMLRSAIENRQFVLDYQPKIACSSQTLVGFEALVRWQHPKAGIIMPDRFIPLVETLGLVDRLTEIVLEDGVRWLAGLQRQGLGRDLSLAVNLSAKTFANLGFADRLAGLCRGADLPPGCLTLELTETAAMEDPVLALDMMTRIRMKGFRLSIDDFGTGYSSMLQLARLPFSEIKIDKSFVMSAGESVESRTIIKSIVDLGHNLGLQTVAEGVEDAAALKFLGEVGCDTAQGFHIARPMSGDAAVQWISERNTFNAAVKRQKKI